MDADAPLTTTMFLKVLVDKSLDLPNIEDRFLHRKSILEFKFP